ncbi:MAG: glycosyltransferase family 4 protein [Anaerolineales bacterium]|nr:glycosyltransferase family 4 protein [Anaerolineales bacterium]
MSVVSEPLRVLLVDHAPILGGVEIMIRDLLTALDPARVAPTLVTDRASPLRGRLGPAVPEIALPLTRLKRNPLAGWSLATSAIQLARAARATRADVMQTFTARTHLIGACAGALARVPVVWRLNDDTLPEGLAAVLGRLPSRIISVSAHLKSHYGRALPVSDIIPDGVPLPTLPTPARARSALHLPPDGPILLLVARLVRWKGHAVFLQALADLMPEFPNLQGVLAGGHSPADDRPGLLAGGAPYEREITALIETLRLANHVTVLGHTHDTAAVFAAADVVVHTSIQPEPFGRVIVEAMAAGRPVVASAAGGPLEIVQDGQTGRLTPPGDSRSLAAALRPLLADAPLRAAMGAAGRRRAEAEYSLPAMAERFTRVWKECARRAPGRPKYV